MFVGLNPSTADESTDDPTIRRCIGFSKAWGVHGAHQDRAAAVLAMLPGIHCLRLTKDGHPGHPLYLPRGLKPVVMAGSRVAR